MPESSHRLDLRELAAGNIPAITAALGAALAAAGGVCLESQGHNPEANLTVRGHRAGSYILTWAPVSAQARLRAYNEQERATEMGAAGIGVLLAQRITGYAALEPCWRGTGFDYWLGEMSAGTPVYRVGLEVSGIRKGSDRQIRARVREKLEQVAQGGRQPWATYVIVVEFGRPQAEVQRNDPRA